MINRLIAGIFTFFVLIGCSSTKGGDSPNAPKTVKSFTLKETLEPIPSLKIHHYIHKKSGLEIFLLPKPDTEIVAFATAYNVGSRFEIKGKTGLAHLFEHMMFRGTESYPEPFKTLSSWGNRFNAYTSSDLTLYHQMVPKSLLPDVARFEGERMRKLLITKLGFDTERGAVVSERKSRVEDSPFGRLFWEMNQLAFDKHPYKTGPIGWQEDLDNATFEDALEFYKRFYAPNRARIAIVGDFSPKEALNILEKNYGNFEAQAFEEPKIEAEPQRQDFRRKIIPMKIESVYIADAVLGKKANEPEAEIDLLICGLLADSKMGYLSFELVEKGLARSIAANCSANVDPDLLSLFIVGNPKITLARLEQAYDSARKGFLKWATAERVEKAKLYFLADQWASLRDPLHLAEQVARLSVTTGDALFAFKSLERLRKLTVEDVQKRYAAWGINKTRVILEPSSKTPPIKARATGAKK